MEESQPADLKARVEHYQSTYRHANLERFEVSQPYSLFPQEGQTSTLKWGDEWPNSRRTGVYLVYSDGGLLYVGTAWMLGSRLACYFRSEDRRDGRCKIIRPDWAESKYVVTIAVPEKSWFEAAALEEYLIYELKPSLNKIGGIV